MSQPFITIERGDDELTVYLEGDHNPDPEIGTETFITNACLEDGTEVELTNAELQKAREAIADHYEREWSEQELENRLSLID